MSQNSGCLFGWFEKLLGRIDVSSESGGDLPPENQPLPYKPRAYLFTRAERSFLGVLLQVSEPKYRVMAKVRLADLLIVEPGTAKRMSWFNRIAAKHVDFVLLDPGSMKCLLAIELDDKSHDEPDRQDRDGFVDRAFEAAGLKVLHIPAKASYNTSEIKALIESALR
jgi:hypothetical protein